MMNEQAEQAQEILNQTGRIRVIVQDNGPIHTRKSKKDGKTGKKKDYMPKYCSQMNPIETEWHPKDVSLD